MPRDFKRCSLQIKSGDTKFASWGKIKTFKSNLKKKLSGTQAASCHQCYLCIEALCHSSRDPSHWCTRWQGGLVLESVPGRKWTEPPLRRRTMGRWLWSFRSGGTAHSSGRARMLREEIEKQQADRFKLIPKIYPCKVTKCSCEMLRCV